MLSYIIMQVEEQKEFYSIVSTYAVSNNNAVELKKEIQGIYLN